MVVLVIGDVVGDPGMDTLYRCLRATEFGGRNQLHCRGYLLRCLYRLYSLFYLFQIHIRR